MVRFIKSSKMAGLPPGELIHIGEKKTETVKVSVVTYDETDVSEFTLEPGDAWPVNRESGVTWINVEGIHQIELLQNLGEILNIHPLVLEDILNTDQRPKMEDLDRYVFIILKVFDYDNDADVLDVEQVSLILGPNYVITFEEKEERVFDPIRDRVKQLSGRIRRMGADYLAYALVDAVIDNYFVVLEKVGEEVELLEDELMTNPDPETLKTIHELKRDMIIMRKAIWPLREAIGNLERGESDLVSESIHIFLRDAYDHTIQVIETIETFREMISGMLDIYLSSVSNRMNEVMKVLTIIATIFIPLTLVVGIYGMNFQHMPELAWRWGYPLVWVVMLVIAGGMLVYFKRKRWL